MENQPDIQEDEIDIGKYINVIIKRKKLIFSIFIAALVIAFIVKPRTSKVYEITSTIQLGSVNELLINKEEAKEIILNQNAISYLIKELNLKTGIETLKNSIQIDDIINTNLLKITIRYDDVDTAIKINNAIINPLLIQGQRIYQERVAIINERLKELNAAVENAEEDIKRTQNLIRNIPSSKDISQADISLRIIILQNTLPEYENNLTQLRNQRTSLRISLVNSKDFKVFVSPVKPEYSVARDKKPNVIIFSVFGLMLGIFLAFFIEFLQRPKKVK